MNKLLQYIGNSIYFIKHHALWLVLFFILVSGSYIIFREFYYFGTLNLYISEENTVLVIEGKGEHECVKNFCSIEIFPGKYKIAIKKEGFTENIQNIDIKRAESVEVKIALKKHSIEMIWGNDGENNEKKINIGVTFPMEKSIIDENIENISFNETSVLYKNQPLYPNTTPLYISSDEIGRNMWIVSESSVSGFSQKYKTLFPALSDSILSFYPQKDGSFSVQNAKSEYFYYADKKIEKLNIETDSLFFACKIPNADKKNMWAYIQQTEQGIGFFIENVDEEKEAKRLPKTIINNLYFSDFKYLECISSSQAKGVLQNGNIFWLNF